MAGWRAKYIPTGGREPSDSRLMLQLRIENAARGARTRVGGGPTLGLAPPRQVPNVPILRRERTRTTEKAAQRLPFLLPRTVAEPPVTRASRFLWGFATSSDDR
jgi:hypothetical protein